MERKFLMSYTSITTLGAPFLPYDCHTLENCDCLALGASHHGEQRVPGPMSAASERTALALCLGSPL